jgi:TPP-dependent pyruvate/acetoin dehydrogenase alpha subunit
LTESGLCEPDDLKEIQEDVEKEVQEAVQFADNSPNPGLELLTEYVYAE